MRVSVVIPAHNEAALIGRTVSAAVRACAGLDAEVVVADDSSDDGTGAIAAAAGARVVRIESRQISAARNGAARAAAGEMLVFVDADTLLSAEALRGAVAKMESGCGYGAGRIVWDEGTPRWCFVFTGLMLPVFRALGLGAGAFLFARRGVFEAVGGFDETLYASEEVAFCRAARKHGRYGWVDAAVVTSGRKLRTHSVWEVLVLFARLAPKRSRGVRTREGLDLWYGPRRPDPGGAAGRSTIRR